MISRAAALGLLAAPAALALTGRPLAAQVAIPLRVATAASDSYGEEFYAADGGFFAKAGLAVTPLIFGNGSEALTAVVSGAADIGVTNPVSLVQAIQHGLPVTCFAGSCYYLSSAPTTALFVAKDGPIHTAKDLEGKTVGLLSIKDFSIAALYEWLAANGADVSKVKVVEVPGSTMGAAVGRGTVAAASIPEPYISGSRSDLRMLGKQFDSIAKRFYICIWATSKPFIASNGNAVRRFTEAIYATAKWANTHHDETAAILAKYSKIDPAVIKRMTRASYGQSLNVADLQPTLDAAYKYKIIDSPVSAVTIITKL